MFSLTVSLVMSVNIMIPDHDGVFDWLLCSSSLFPEANKVLIRRARTSLVNDRLYSYLLV